MFIDAQDLVNKTANFMANFTIDPNSATSNFSTEVNANSNAVNKAEVACGFFALCGLLIISYFCFCNRRNVNSRRAMSTEDMAPNYNGYYSSSTRSTSTNLKNISSNSTGAHYVDMFRSSTPIQGQSSRFPTNLKSASSESTETELGLSQKYNS